MPVRSEAGIKTPRSGKRNYYGLTSCSLYCDIKIYIFFFREKVSQARDFSHWETRHVFHADVFESNHGYTAVGGISHPTAKRKYTSDPHFFLTVK